MELNFIKTSEKNKHIIKLSKSPLKTKVFRDFFILSKFLDYEHRNNKIEREKVTFLIRASKKTSEFYKTVYGRKKRFYQASIANRAPEREFIPAAVY